MVSPAPRRRPRIAPLFLAALALARSTTAQVLSPGPRTPPKWTIEAHAGAVLGPTPTGGDAGRLPTGTTFTTEPRAPSRANASWFFGDGAALFNEVNAQFASRFNIRFPQIAPLDGMLTTSALDRSRSRSLGFRVTREITRRWGAEFSFDRASSAVALTADAKNAIEATRASFERGFSGLLATMPLARLQIASTADLAQVTADRRIITGALTIALTRRGRIATYALAGAGRVSSDADPLSIRLNGTYQFRFLDTFPIKESDTVTVRLAERASSTVALVGGGVTANLSRRHGIRGDVRLLLGTSGAATTLDASASVERVSPFVALPSLTTPSLQFSTTADRSSLDGSIADLRTFTGRGLDMRMLLAIGYFVRF